MFFICNFIRLDSTINVLFGRTLVCVWSCVDVGNEYFAIFALLKLIIVHKKILNLAIPNAISSITVPLLGMVDIAIAGRLPYGDTAIGALAVGTTIFNFMYWNCVFIRMGNSGLTAQAYGARDFKECINILSRSIFLSILMAVLLMLFQKIIGELSFSVMDGSQAIHDLGREYFYARIWAAPATITLFAIHGWFIGMQNAKTPMWTSVIVNIVNIVLGLLFVFKYDMGISGIAWATVAAQYSGLLFSVVVWFLKYSRFLEYLDLKESLNLSSLIHFLNINKDILLRTSCIVMVYTFFTVASTSMGDTILTVNILLMQLVTLFSYLSDGVGYAAESLIGKYFGAKNKIAIKECINKLFLWAGIIAVIFSVVYATSWSFVLSIFTDSPAIIEESKNYIVWLVVVPLAGFAPFLMDGILIGATQTKVLRDTTFLAMALFFIVYYTFVDTIGNNALWFAFVTFMVSRCIFQLIATKRLSILTK